MSMHERFQASLLGELVCTDDQARRQELLELLQAGADNEDEVEYLFQAACRKERERQHGQTPTRAEDRQDP